MGHQRILLILRRTLAIFLVLVIVYILKQLSGKDWTWFALLFVVLMAPFIFFVACLAYGFWFNRYQVICRALLIANCFLVWFVASSFIRFLFPLADQWGDRGGWFLLLGLGLSIGWFVIPIYAAKKFHDFFNLRIEKASLKAEA